MKDASELTVVQLKDVLRSLDLQTAGNKAELLKRLNDSYPNGEWIEQIDVAAMFPNPSPIETPVIITANTSTSVQGASAPLNTDTNALLLKEMEFMRREKALMERELDLARRENEFLRQTPHSDSTTSHGSTTKSRDVRELLNTYSGSDDSFSKWEKQVRLLHTTYRLDAEEMKILIVSKLKGKAQDWFYSKPEFIEMDFEQLLMEMKGMYDHRLNKLALRRQFEKRSWRSSESFSEYFHEKVIMANSVPIDEDEIVDYVIEGIPDRAIQNQARLQRFTSKAALFEAFERITLTAETKNQQRRVTRPGTSNETFLPAISKNAAVTQDREPLRCYNCNKTGHIAAACKKSKRPPGSCFNCGEFGHIVRNCPKKEDAKPVNIVQEAPLEDFHRNISYKIANKISILFTLFDTGSPISFIKEKYVPRELIEAAEELSGKYCGINDSALSISGTVKINITHDGITRRDVNLCVVPNHTMTASVVWGRDLLKLFNLSLTSSYVDDPLHEIMNIEQSCASDTVADSLVVNSEVPKQEVLRLKKLFLTEYVNAKRPESPQVRTELRLTLREHEPFHFMPRRLSCVEKEKLSEILDELLVKGIIQPSESEYASPVVLVKKKNGQLRLCVDYRALNKITSRDNYPLPIIEEQLNILNNKKYFTLLDLKDGFHHIDVAKESIKYTSFVTPLGQFEYRKMPFGLKTAPSKFQRFVNDVLADLIKSGDIAVYLDDFLIATPTLEDHLSVLRRVFRLLVKNRLELRLDKCKFMYTEIEYLGYTVTSAGISPTRRGIEAITKFPLPRNMREVQSFLGLTSYFRKFIDKFSVIAKPLYDLLRKGTIFEFNKTQLEAFETLKSKLIAAPVLALYDPKDETELHCDASSVGFGAVLMQRKADAKFHPVFFFSKRTSDAETKYHSFELETLAIIYALKRFRIYLQGLKFKIITDCNSLTLTLNKKEINPRIARWALELGNYDYEVEHRSNTRMMHVDALSRLSTILVIQDNPFELNLSLCQNQDAKIQEIRTELEKRESSFFELRNGLVYRKNGGELLFYVPESMEKNVIFRYHDNMGHLGTHKTCSVIRKSYWFPNMTSKVETHIKNCLKCISFSPQTGKAKGFLQIIPKGNVPFVTIHIDHYGPVDKQHSTKKYVFVVVDAFSKFVKLYATKTTSSKEAINYLSQYFNNFSVPINIVSDRGTCFTSKEFEEFMKNNDIKHIKIATGSPQANGQVERVNRVLTPMLSKLVDNPSGKFWFKILGDVEHVMNNTVNKATGETPSKLLFGVDQRGKDDKIKEYIEANVCDSSRDLVSLRAAAAENNLKSQAYNKAYVDKKRNEAYKYKVDDYVMLRNFENTPGIPKKLIPRFKGPYAIKKILRNNRYLVADIDGYQATQKPYKGVWEPANMRLWRATKIDDDNQ